MTPIDQAVRDRIGAGGEEALFVEAGAGTGKTTALVARVVALVRRGEVLTDISRLAAITFTENAASELRTRIRLALQTELNDTSGQEHDRVQRAVDLLDEAAITTLHGFALRLLADFPLEAGLPPGFTVEDDTTAALARDRWWQQFVTTSLADPDLAEAWRTALSLDLRVDSLRPVAEAFSSSYDVLGAGPPAAPASTQWDLEPVIAHLRSVVGAYADRVAVDDALASHLTEVLRPLLADLAAEKDELGQAAVLSGVKLSCTGGKRGVWAAAGIDKSSVVDELSTLAGMWSERREAVCQAVLARLLGALRAAVLEEADRRRRDGRLEFQDLLVLARDLLRDDVVRAALSERWHVVLVDEFQDTDPLQAEIVHLLTAASPPSHWTEAAVAPGRLFFVGDPKQSIYRFRRADIGLYRQVQRAHDEVLSLTSNFRSRPGVLDVVNAGLSALMVGAEQVPYAPLIAHRHEAQGDPGPDVVLLGGPAGKGVKVDRLRQTEAAHVARTVRRVKDERWAVTNRTDGAQYSDITVLVPTRTSLGALEDALQDVDVPYRIESRSLIWDTDAVRDLLTLLEAVDDPGDAVAVVASLRHPGFACSDDDLVRWAARGGRWTLWDAAPEGLEDSPVALGLAALHRYHQLRWWLPVNELLDLVVRERRLVELTTALPRPRDHWRRLRFVVDQARAFLDAGGDGVGGFVRWARQQAERGADAVEAPVPEPDDDAVRIMTIHAAKGLEFPVVVLTGINVDPMPAGPVVWDESGPQVKIKSFMTPGCEQARKRDGLLTAAEAVRVLYVGATRAVDHLVMSLHHKTSGGPARNHARRLYELLDSLVAAGAVHELLAPAAPQPPAAVGSRPAFDAEPYLDFLLEREGLLADVRQRLPVSPSGLVASSAAVDVCQEPADPLVDAEQAHRPSGGATLGTLVHRALELVDFAHPDVDMAVVQAADELQARHLAEPARQRVQVALSSTLVQEAAASRHWKEVPVVAHLRGRLVEGVVDLVFERPEGLVVVDYKTDALPDTAAADAKAAAYAPQLTAYVDAVEQATDQRVVEAAVLFIGVDRWLLRRPALLAADGSDSG